MFCESNIDEGTSSQASETIPDCFSDEVSRISTAIAYNDLIDDRLNRLELLLKKRLRECREKMQIILDNVDSSSRHVKKRFKFSQCGMPYFIDHNGWQAPYNTEANAIRRQDMIQYYETDPNPWTIRQKRDFLHVMHYMSINIRINEINELIKQNKPRGSRRKQLKAEMATVHMKPLAELCLPIEREYHWREIADILKGHSAEECSSLWKMELHPSINNNVWSDEEVKQLNNLIIQHKNEDWEAIASELNTGRTAFQCFMKFNAKAVGSSKSKSWSDDDDILLTRLVELFKVNNYIPWAKVAIAMPNRTEAEVYARWRQHHYMKGRFLPEEDEVLLLCVKMYGENFHLITKYLKRSEGQLARRYRILSKEEACKWKYSEDEVIWNMTKNDTAPNFVKIAKRLKGRTPTQVCVRHLTLNRWLNKHDWVNRDKTSALLSTVPRRTNNCIVQDTSSISEDLVAALKKLDEKLETKVKETTQSTLTLNDTGIIHFLYEEEFKNNIDNNIKEEVKGQEINLQVFQFMLRAVLDKETVDSKPYFEDYKSVLDNITVNKKVRSYSRKSVDTANSTVELKMPDLWGNKFGDPPRFIFPPNINTLMACKKLLADYYNYKISGNKSVRKMKAKNMSFNAQWHLLLSRINILFLWPLKLSYTSAFIHRHK